MIRLEEYNIHIIKMITYVYRGTPSIPEHRGDFRILKKAHQTSWNQRHPRCRQKCKICYQNDTELYVEEIDTLKNKIKNVCIECYSYFFD